MRLQAMFLDKIINYYKTHYNDSHNVLRTIDKTQNTQKAALFIML